MRENVRRLNGRIQLLEAAFFREEEFSDEGRQW